MDLIKLVFKSHVSSLTYLQGTMTIDRLVRSALSSGIPTREHPGVPKANPPHRPRFDISRGGLVDKTLPAPGVRKVAPLVLCGVSDWRRMPVNFDGDQRTISWSCLTVSRKVVLVTIAEILYQPKAYFTTNRRANRRLRVHGNFYCCVTTLSRFCH